MLSYVNQRIPLQFIHTRQKTDNIVTFKYTRKSKNVSNYSLNFQLDPQCLEFTHSGRNINRLDMAASSLEALFDQRKGYRMSLFAKTIKLWKAKSVSTRKHQFVRVKLI